MLIAKGIFYTARKSVSIQNLVSNYNKALDCQTWGHISRNDIICSKTSGGLSQYHASNYS